MTLDELTDYFLANDRFIVASHDGPDADGLGAVYALVLALRSIGKQAVPTVADNVPAKYRFIDQAGIFVPVSASDWPPFDPAESTLIVMDTHDFTYLGSSGERLLAAARRYLAIDHHELKGDPGPLSFVDPTASSSCELVYQLVRRLGVQLPRDAAEAIFAGMVYDTGSFAYPKTSERTFAFASELVRLGVQPYAIHNHLYESGSIGVLILQKMVFSTLELHSENRIAVQTLRRSDLAVSGAAYEDAEDLVNIPLQGRTIEVSILFKENLQGRLRCSLRSKGQINVAHIAQSFGGGGHKTAAGFTCVSPLESSKADVLQTIGKALSRA
ncbi:MAG TPA: bifunctional oligoribonuclease/PAP phosphatase NrnA [Rectinemataceae bacterium]|nr:bifunctional oligoribonuclease/PAP phosphatase NrnA [Rectinemataceae bacterium]